MKKLNTLKAALLGCAVLFTASVTPAQSDTLRIVRSGSSSTLPIPMNRAVVVESDVPFAELSIANPSIADISTLSDRTVYVLGKSPGLTTLTLLDEAGRLITNVDVRVSADVSEFKERLKQILPGEKIEVRTANDGIVLSGTVSSAGKVDRAMDLAQRYAPERVTNLLTVGGVQQVMLKVRFAEMQRSVSKQLSTSLALGGSALGGNLGITGGTNTLNTSRAVNRDLLPGASDKNAATLFGFNAGGVEVGILLEALETKGMVRTLAEPNLTALSGQEAKFLAGGEYPIPVVGQNGVQVQFKPFGVQLAFIPRVLDDKVINLELNAEVSSLDEANGIVSDGFTIAGLKVRRTSTTVEMRDGESFAIAGLLQDDFTDLSGQVPWLGDVPILGALFRSADYARRQSELVIIITPHLVTPTRGEALALPTDRVRPPTEKDLFLFGRVTGESRRPKKGAAAEIATQDFTAPYGYVMD